MTILSWTPTSVDVDGVAAAGTAEDGTVVICYDDGAAVFARPDGTQEVGTWQASEGSGLPIGYFVDVQ